MTIVALAGDWHGSKPWASSRIMSVGARGITTVLHVGDFGIWPGPGGRGFLLSVDRTCERAGVEQVLVTPGNHEDWGRLTALWASDMRRDPETGDPMPVRLSDYVTVLPRGHAFEMAGRRFVSLGGAPSVDLHWRTEGRDWWPEERITEEDVERTIRNGAGVDVMLAHDSPDAPWWSPKVAAICGTNEWGWTDRALAFADEGRRQMTQAIEGVRPRLFVHGHYHVADEAAVRLPGADHETRIWCLNRDGQAGNVRYLDLETLDEPEWAR